MSGQTNVAEQDQNTDNGNSELSKGSKTELLGSIQRDESHLIQFESFDQDLPQIKEIECNKRDIERYVMKGVFSVFPPTVHNDVKRLLSQRIQGLFKPGLAYIADNMSVIANIAKPKQLPQPDDVILDVCLLVQDMAPAVLTLVRDDCVSLKASEAYNLNLARGITTSVLRFTKEQFSVVYGVFKTSELETTESFKKFLNRIREETGRWSIPSSLRMNRNKYNKIITAFVTSVALTSSVVNDDNSDTLWFLTLEQFCVLAENIDQPEVVVKTAPSSGRKVLMREVARRLDLSGPTLLVMESEEQKQVAKSQGVCSYTLTQGEWVRTLMGGSQLEGLTHIVTNCQGCPTLAGLKGKFWSFVPDPEAVQQKGEQGVSAGETKSQPKRTPVQDVAMVEQVRKLESELEIRDMEIRKLSEEVTTLKQTEDELSRMLDSVSIGGYSLDSGRGSDTSSLFSTSSRSTSGTPDPQGAPGGQTASKGLLKNIKKRLAIGKTKRKDSEELMGKKSKLFVDEVPDFMTVYVLSDEDQESSIALLCRRHELSRDRVNTKVCHLTEDGHLINKPSKRQDDDEEEETFVYYGTCSTNPLPLRPSSTPFPLGPQYWETETIVGMKGRRGEEWYWLVLEVGVAQKDTLDSDWRLYGKSRSWCVIVAGCEAHRPGYCTQVWNQRKHVACVRDTLQNLPGASFIYRIGVVVDVGMGTIGFIDVARGSVLHVMNAEFKKSLYPVFGVFPLPEYARVEMTLISGTDVKMTKSKQKLIHSCLA